MKDKMDRLDPIVDRDRRSRGTPAGLLHNMNVAKLVSQAFRSNNSVGPKMLGLKAKPPTVRLTQSVNDIQSLGKFDVRIEFIANSGGIWDFSAV